MKSTIKNTILVGVTALGVICSGGSNAFATTVDADGVEWYTYPETLAVRKEVIAEQDAVCDRSDLTCREEYMLTHSLDSRYNLASHIGDGVQMISYIDFNSNQLGFFYYGGDQDLSPWGMHFGGEEEIEMISFVRYDDSGGWNTIQSLTYEQVKTGGVYGNTGVLANWTRGKNGPLLDGSETMIQLPEMDLTQFLFSNSKGIVMLVFVNSGGDPYLQTILPLSMGHFQMMTPDCSTAEGKACEIMLNGDIDVGGFKYRAIDPRYDRSDAGDENDEEGKDKGTEEGEGGKQGTEEGQNKGNEEAAANGILATEVEPEGEIIATASGEGKSGYEEGAVQRGNELALNEGSATSRTTKADKGATTGATEQGPTEEQGDSSVAPAGAEDGYATALGVTSGADEEESLSNVIIPVATTIAAISGVVAVAFLGVSRFRAKKP